MKYVCWACVLVYPTLCITFSSNLGRIMYNLCSTFSSHLISLYVLYRSIFLICIFIFISLGFCLFSGLAMLWVLGYLFILIFIFALISFAFYRELYSSESGLYCTTAYECLTTVLHRGLIVGTYEVRKERVGEICVKVGQITPVSNRKAWGIY